MRDALRLGRGLVVGISLGLGLALSVCADDWPNWRGPNHNGISTETGWKANQDGSFKVTWRAEVGQGWSAVTVADGRAYTMGNRDNTDTVYCLDAFTGQEIWKKSYRCAPGSYPGPRSTPTVDGTSVYTMSREGHLNCFDTTSGKVKWTRTLSATTPTWGFASSPVIHGGLVMVNVGDAGMAFSKANGRPAWSTGGGACGYASPVVYKDGSRTIVLMFSAKALMGVSTSGRVGWAFPWETQYDVNAGDPVVVGKNVFISTGYGTGCALISLARGRPRQVWRNTNMRNHYNSCVLWQDCIYGLDDDGELRCLDARTGRVKWSERGPGKGGLILVDGKLIIQGAGGELFIAEASPDGYKEFARGRVLSGTCWTSPVLANGRIYCRNSTGEVVCVDVSGN